MEAHPDALPADRRRPHPDRLAPGSPRYAEILAAHDDAVHRGETGYEDPASGLWVMTAEYLWSRGFCCDSRCRHCPYAER